jgi:phosphoglucosamine mutase
VSPKVFSELGAQVLAICVQPNGVNINHACGSTDIAGLRDKVLQEKADLGIALDGDGDRVIMVDSKGEIVDGDELLMIICDYLIQRQRFHGGVVGTQMSNYGLEQALKSRSVPFVRAKVGDRYVMQELLKRQWLLGGEGSGHLICRLAQTTGDGTISALLVLAALINAGTTLHELKQLMTKLPQRMINVEFERRDPDLLQRSEIQQAVAAAEEWLADTGRVLLRLSGTEPVVRVMVEGQDSRLVTKLTMDLATTVEQLVG